jgi:death-on-curing protein
VEYIPITLNDLKILHNTVIKETGGEYGIFSAGVLQACCDRLTNEFFGFEQFSNIFHKASALLEGINKWHGFADGNKRTALQAVHLFLELNGWQFNPDNLAVNLSLQVAQCKHDISDVEAWIQNCSIPK